VAKKTKQRRKPAPSRRATPARTAAATESTAPAAHSTAAPATPASAGTAPARRGIERVDPASRRAQAGRPAKADPGFAPLEADDPAIPFDRVPYVPGDLRRVAVMAAVMVVLIVVVNVVLAKVSG
jgi:hypothetical protein